MSDDAPESMCKAERLRVAGVAVPNYRRNIDRTTKRVVHVVDRNDPTRVLWDTTLDVVQRARLREAELESAVQPDVRPKTITCLGCKAPVHVGKTGAIPTRCRRCKVGECCWCGLPRLARIGLSAKKKKATFACSRAECVESRQEYRRLSCSTPGCNNRLGPRSSSASAVRQRGGQPAVCQPCHRSNIYRSRRAKAAARTHCRRGHDMRDASNVRTMRSGHPCCRSCERIAREARREAAAK